MYRISANSTVDAAHGLSDRPAGHQNGRLHGHSYAVTVVVEAADLVQPGFVTGFGELSPVRRHLDECLDHGLPDTVPGPAVMCGLLARHLMGWLAEHMQPDVPGRLPAVRVTQAATWAEYEVADR